MAARVKIRGMLRLAVSLCSGLVLVLSYFWLAGVPTTLAAEEQILAPGDPPLTRDVSDVAAEVALFTPAVDRLGPGGRRHLSP